MSSDNGDRVILTHPLGATATILKYGATCILWTVGGAERLWLSEGAHLDGSKAVRGGIPLVFPVFGPGKKNHPTEALPQHGFARTSTWEFLGQTTSDPVAVQFGLGPEQVPEATRALWATPADFLVVVTFTLSATLLTTAVEVANTGSAAFDFQWLFHTYLRVQAIDSVAVQGLVGQTRLNQLTSADVTDSHEVVFSEEYDLVYKQVPESVAITVAEHGAVTHTTRRVNLPDAVVWNPWIAKAGGMADFTPKDGYRHMVCVEPGHVSSFVSLAPGALWHASQELL